MDSDELFFKTFRYISLFNMLILPVVAYMNFINGLWWMSIIDMVVCGWMLYIFLDANKHIAIGWM